MAHRPEVQAQSLKQALVVGGQHSFVKEKLAKSLTRHGIRVHTHWSWDKKRPPQVFPQGIDLVYICTDMVGHGLSEPCMNWAREIGIPYINGTRKWAESIIRLTQGGFPLLDPLTVVPEIIEEIRRTRTATQMAEGPSQNEMLALAAAFTGDLNTADTTLAAYNAETGHVHLPASDSHASSVLHTSLLDQETAPMTVMGPNNTHLAITNSKQREYLRSLAFNPDCDNTDIWNKLCLQPLFIGNKFDPERASSARKSLGITITRKGGMRTTTVNTQVFNATLKIAKIEGYPAPKASYVSKDAAFQRLAKPEEAAAQESVQIPLISPPPARVEAPAPAPAPIPAPVVIEKPAPAIAKASEWPNDDFKTLLSLMREHMTAYNLKVLTITETGVSFKRIEVVEGDLAL